MHASSNLAWSSSSRSAARCRPLTSSHAAKQSPPPTAHCRGCETRPLLPSELARTRAGRCRDPAHIPADPRNSATRSTGQGRRRSLAHPCSSSRLPPLWTRCRFGPGAVRPTSQKGRRRRLRSPAAEEAAFQAPPAVLLLGLTMRRPLRGPARRRHVGRRRPGGADERVIERPLAEGCGSARPVGLPRPGSASGRRRNWYVRGPLVRSSADEPGTPPAACLSCDNHLLLPLPFFPHRRSQP